MGFGACRALPESKTHHCKSFYWDLSSIVAKTVCLGAFLVVEGPRRLVCYATRKPEPKPFFTCARWGYRMCACGHHYYDHENAPPTNLLMPEKPPSVQPDRLSVPVDTRESLSETKSLIAPVGIPNKSKSKRKRKRRWYWPF